MGKSKYFYEIKDKKALRRKFGIGEESFVVGSFQRDTEGYDLKTPKASKGPDIFVKNVVELSKIKNNLVVLLAGYRRQFIINELEKIILNINILKSLNFKLLTNYIIA